MVQAYLAPRRVHDKGCLLAPVLLARAPLVELRHLLLQRHELVLLFVLLLLSRIQVDVDEGLVLDRLGDGRRLVVLLRFRKLAESDLPMTLLLKRLAPNLFPFHL